MAKYSLGQEVRLIGYTSKRAIVTRIKETEEEVRYQIEFPEDDHQRVSGILEMHLYPARTKKLDLI